MTGLKPEYRSTSTGYGLDNQQAGVLVPIVSKIVFYTSSRQAEAHLASYPMGTGGCFPGGKAEHSPPISSEIKKVDL
jgi:hypothetical protein